MFDICQQVDEFVPYEVFSSQMKQFNIELKDIIDDMLHKKSKHPTKSLHIFLIGGASTRKTFTLMCIIQNMLQHYIRNIILANPLKPKIMKLTYTSKTTFNINNTTIHFALAMFLDKNLRKLKALSDEKCDASI